MHHHDDIERALCAALPHADPAAVAELATLLAAALRDGDARRTETMPPAVAALLEQLAGRRISDGTTQISFGAGNQFGDVEIGDVVGGNLTKMSFQIAAPETLQQIHADNATVSGVRQIRADNYYEAPQPRLTREEQQDRRNRTALLDQVEQFWVRGVLDHSLHDLARIELGFQTRPDVVAHPWETLTRLPDQPPHPLPAGTDVAEVFRDQGERLLILGAPGVGKTTTLLLLAEQLVVTARADDTQPIPIIFQLSTWTDGKPPLDDWPVDELRKRYSVPPKLGAALVEQDALLLLLDGLDEVGPTDRERAACVAAINAFRDEHNVPLVVCSRTTEYAELQARFQLAALEIQSLEPPPRRCCHRA